jgi:hypothetical protein
VQRLNILKQEAEAKTNIQYVQTAAPTQEIMGLQVLLWPFEHQ